MQHNLEHHYHNEDNQTLFLSSNAIPVTTCVTVSSEDQVLEVQLQNETEQELDDEREEMAEQMESEEANVAEGEHDYAVHDNSDETNEAVNALKYSVGNEWNLTSDGIILMNQSSDDTSKAEHNIEFNESEDAKRDYE